MQLSSSINLEFSEKYSLLVRIAPNTFSYCVYEEGAKENFSYEEIEYSIEKNGMDYFEQMIFDSEFFGLPFARTAVIFVSDDYSLVPHYIIQPDKKEILYSFTHTALPKQILYSPYIIQQITTVFNVEIEMYKFLSRNLVTPQFYHHANVIMEALELENKNDVETSKMYLSFHDEFTDIFCYNKSSQIIHAITLRGEKEQNLVYHILNIWDKCGFDQQKDILIILNNKGSSNFYLPSVLDDYIKNLKYIDFFTNKDTVNISDMHEVLPLDILMLSVK